MEYRKAGPEDAEALARYRVAQLDEEEPHPDVEILPALVTWFREKLQEEDVYFLLAEEDGLIVATGGFLLIPMPPSFFKPTGRIAYVMSMYTRPEYRRRGAATGILTRLRDEAKRRGMDRMILEASPWGKPVYERFGFSDMDSWMKYQL